MTSSQLYQFQKVELGFFPTPIVELNTLSAYLKGPKIFIKRDDQTGLAFGGNKTRKLEYILGDAMQKEADTIITAGAAQSNHCRQTAAAAAKLGLECHLVLGGNEPHTKSGNLLLDTLFGAQIHWCGNNRKGEDIPKLFNELKESGKTPYIVPYGGSNELGALGFVEAMNEIEGQMDTSQLTAIFFASSSGGTHSGMLIGKKLLNRDYKLVGINIDKDEINGMRLESWILELTRETATLMGIDSKEFSELFLDDGYLGDGYGVVGKQDKNAIELLARTEGILVDPVYTGRAFAGMIDKIKKGHFSARDSILFWHTGGSPALFAYADKLV